MVLNSEMREFFAAMLPSGIGPDQRIATWDDRTKRSRYWRDVDAICNHDWPTDRNTYVGACLAPTGMDGFHRPSAREVVAAMGIWADVDVAGPGHKKGNLPPTEDDALNLLAEMPIFPTVIVQSGGGFQAWWALAELYPLTDDTRDYFAEIVRRWQALLRQKSSAHGWDLDATHDLARLMRLPGSYNVKYDPPKLVAIHFIDGHRFTNPPRRYTLDDFEQHLNIVVLPSPLPQIPDADQFAPTSMFIMPARPAPADGAGFRIRHDAALPAAMVDELCDLMPSFGAIWRRKSDASDQSPSAYEMRLACLGARLKWTDQMIVDACQHWRRQHGELSAKAARVDYYELTIRKARESRAVATRLESASIDDKGSDDDGRANLLVAISRELGLVNPDGSGIVIQSVIQYNSRPERWAIVIDDHHREIGEASSIANLNDFSDLVFDVCGRRVKRLKLGDWKAVQEAMWRAKDVQDVGADGSPFQLFANQVDSFLRSKYMPATDWQVAAIQSQPFVRDGDVFISVVGANGLGDWIYQITRERLAMNKFGPMLRDLGWQPDANRTIRVERSRVSRSFWRAPSELYPFLAETTEKSAKKELVGVQKDID